MNCLYKGLCLLSLFLCSIVSALADAPNGKTLTTQGNDRGATACQVCHGKKGLGNAQAGYPYLAGLPASYIKSQLQAFANGQRSNAIMESNASALNAQEVAAVSRYYARLENPRLSKLISRENISDSRARKLLVDGQWQIGIPGCFSCHGPQGKGVAPHFPPLIGQPYSYIKNQLIAWQKGKRSNDPLQLMQTVSEALNADDIDSVARYLSQSETP